MEGESWRDALGKLLVDLKSKNRSVQREAATNLRNYITSQSREMSGEAFNKFMNEFQGLIMELVSSTVISDKIGGIYAIRELIDIEYADDATKITRLVNSLRIGLQSNDPVVMDMASKALGRLAQASGTLTAEFVEFEVKRALEWLQESSPAKRHAAVLVLKELGSNAPTLFYVHIASFFDVIWDAIHDNNVSIREEAVQALRAALLLISERDSRWRLQWYHKTFEEAMKGIKSSNSASIHGSLITIGELLTNTGDFMQTRFREVCDTVLRYRDHKDKLVKRTVITLLPRLALFNADLFVKKDLGAAMNHLLGALKKERAEERSAAFLALGEMALAVEGQIKPYLDNIIKIIKAALSPKSKAFCSEALTCISMLSAGCGPSMQSHVHSLLDLMFTPGLNSTLTEALKEVSEHIPALLPTIQDKLLDHLSMVLANKPFIYPGKHPAVSLAGGREAGGLLAQYEGKERNPEIIQLALNTLGSFSFKQNILTDFVRDTVVGYLDDDNSQTRREAALTCSTLLVPPNELAPTRGHLASVIGEVLEKLLIAGIADTDPRIRQAVLASLDWRFDHHLAQAENLRSLFIALNDENFEIRELAITIIGRLTVRNPAYVMPSLRKTLIQLLTELEFSGDSRNKEESAKLLGQLIKASQSLIKPYVEPILNALLPKLTDSSPRVTSCVLSALGELSLVASVGMLPHVEALLPLIIDTLQDQSSMVKREVALRTLGQLAESTGYVVEPFLKHPRLLDILLSAVKSEQAPTIRREVVKVLGILGALDPYKHKVNQLTEARKKRDADVSATPNILAGMTPSSETVAVIALLTILRNSTLATHHRDVIQAIMFIFKTLGLKCIPYLPQIMPAYLNVMKTCEPLFRQFLFQQLGELVRIVKQHIRDYLEDIFELIKEYWPTNLLNQIINLVEEISIALNDEFNVYLPELIPSMLKVLHSYHVTGRDDSIGRVLHALEVFGTNLDDYLHLIIPAIVKLFEQVDVSIKVRILSIQTLGRLSEKLTFSDYASRIIHPLARVLDHASAGTELQKEGMLTLCALVYQLGSDYAIFVPMVDKVLTKNRIHNAVYDSLVSRVLNNQPLLPEHLGEEGSRIHRDSRGSSGAGPEPEVSRAALNVNVRALKAAWEASQRSTKGDWEEWIRRFSVVLLKESPSPALRSCLSLAQVYHPLAKELFNASFVSCWGELQEAYQELLVQSLETALRAENIPPEILQTLLNLAEFMEHDEKPLPIDIRTLGALAEKCAAYAKALHYKETEFQSSPTSTVEALISINNQLGQPDAAVGILLHAQRFHDIELKESWYEKLHRWDAALEVYRKKQLEQPMSMPLTLGRMRCLHALGEWEGLSDLAKKTWRAADASVRSTIAPLAAAAAWNLGQWGQMRDYNSAMSGKTIDGTFFRAISCLHQDEYDEGQHYIDETRRLLDNELRALVGESYDRAYKVVVRVQQLSEMEEIINYKLSDDSRREQLRAIWTKRLSHCQRSLEVWQDILAVRKLVIPPIEDMDNWLKFATICRKNSRSRLAHKTLVDLLGENPSETGRLPTRHPKVTFAYIKHLWATAEQGTPDKRKPAQKVAYTQLREYVKSIKENSPLLARCHLKLGQWHAALNDGKYDDESIPSILSSFQQATKHDTTWHKAWQSWAIANFEAVQYFERVGDKRKLQPHLVPALQGFFRSIALSHGGQSLQAVLRLMTIWFQYGGQKPVEEALTDGFNSVTIDTWLQVIPQLIARIHSPIPGVRRLIHEMLINVGQMHPQALVYPLSVASKSQSAQRMEAAMRILDDMRKHSAVLVEQALLVSQELIRVAILWHERWYEGLEEASRQYFTHHNPEGMLATLEPLHAMLARGACTLREVAFEQAFGRDLQEAHEWCQKYTRSTKVADLNQAWDLYYHVFRRINKQLPHMTTLELQYVSPKLLAARDLELAVPGTYDFNAEVVRIGGFAPSLSVYSSKQRPRKLVMSGSNGKDYEFLLKGHEDLRQDERVMQLFGLINSLLATDAETAKRHLKIQQYAIIPLSPNSGLIGWVPNHDTLHVLIRDYRESRMLVLNKEHRLMMGMAGPGPDMYDKLTLIQKVEVFEHALDSTPGNDLDRVLWLKSPNSEVWLERRTNYTRSLAVMSMVGYILGLGDRHPSNLMLDRHSGKITHIDFGDCFEVAMHREKYPEKIPFRLTRMLIKAMEVSGIEGNFRFTCESTMRVLREHKESVMAVLEAFVHDPLINWRLLTPNSPSEGDGEDKGENLLEAGEDTTDHASFDAEGSDPGSFFSASVSSRGRGPSHKGKERPEEPLELGAPEILNEKALSVVERVEAKLRGRDFNKDEPLDVPAQVQKLIDQATSHENLCQCYIGWCPFW